MKKIVQTKTFNAKPEEIYNAWLDGKKHGEMIGADAKIEGKEGSDFSMWDGEIYGKIISLDSKKYKIVQEWSSKSGNFPENEPSTLTLEFLPDGEKTKVVLTQENIPDSEYDDLSEGWEDFYWKPMEKYFS